MTMPVRQRRRSQNFISTTSLNPSGEVLYNDPHISLALTTEYTAPESLKPPARKLRKNRARQMAAIRSSIRAFGFLNPILVDENNRIICGHARWLAAKDLGLAEVPVIRVSHLSDEQKRLYAIAENRAGELGEWDDEALRLEFGELLDLGLSLDLNLELSGFAMSEIDDMLVKPAGAKRESSALPDHPAVTQTGDLILLGNHKLLCGNALEKASYEILMGEDRAQMVFSDLPYNLPMRSISGMGQAAHEDFAMGAGEMDRAGFTQFMQTSFGLMAQFSQDGAVHYQCMDWRHMSEMLAAGEAVYSELKNLVVWNKGSGGMGTFYRSQHELIFVWKVGSAPHINNFGLGDTGRYRTNVWDYRGNNSFHASRDAELAAHATVKPQALVADAMRDCSLPGGIVLDGFGGSGTTLIAAEQTGRYARLIEIDPKYCDRTIERWQAVTGKEAVFASSGKSWSQVASERGVELGASAESNLQAEDV